MAHRYKMEAIQTDDGIITVPAKPVYESATFWVNLLTVLAVLVSELTNQNIVSYFVTDPGQAAVLSRWLLGILALVNILLRVFKTKQPVFI